MKVYKVFYTDIETDNYQEVNILIGYASTYEKAEEARLQALKSFGWDEEDLHSIYIEPYELDKFFF